MYQRSVTGLKSLEVDFNVLGFEIIINYRDKPRLPACIRKKENVLVKTDICYLIEEMIVRYSSVVEEKKIILSLSCPLNTHWIVAEAATLNEVFEILLKNMLDLSNEAEVIELSIIPGDLFLTVDFLNRSRSVGAEQLHAFLLIQQICIIPLYTKPVSWRFMH